MPRAVGVSMTMYNNTRFELQICWKEIISSGLVQEQLVLEQDDGPVTRNADSS